MESRETDKKDLGLRGRPVGTNLKALCLKAGISQAELSREANMNRATIRAAELDGHSVKVLTRNKILLAFNRLAEPGLQTTIDAMFPPKA